jgi:hypothetical protein
MASRDTTIAGTVNTKCNGLNRSSLTDFQKLMALKWIIERDKKKPDLDKR